MKRKILYALFALVLLTSLALPIFTFTETAFAHTQVVFTVTPVGGTWTVPAGVTELQVLVVAGGGGGGSLSGSTRGEGGGGAGGVSYNAAYTVTPGQIITVTVGTGGNAVGGDAESGNGTNSVFGTITSTGGGAGGHISGQNGGSGGGACGIAGSHGGYGTAGQGNDGGNVTGAGHFGGGGGGGADADGAGGTDAVGGNGGSGHDYSAIFGAAVGEAGWFGGGGGGGADGTGVAGTGGNGGGGDGAKGGDAGAGLANTGGGGGASGQWKSNIEGDGGKGVVIVRYCDAPTVVTLAASGVGTIQATVNGNITNVDTVNATIRGFQYDTDAGAPYTFDTHEHGSYAAGNYSLLLSSLDTGTTYYFRAYATNTGGTGYGAEGNFTTMVSPPTVASWEVAGWGETWVILKGKMWVGSALISEGFNYGLTTSYGGNSTETLSIAAGGYFVHTIYNLTPSTLYHWRAWGTNAIGTGLGVDSYFFTGTPSFYEYADTLGNTSSGDIYGTTYYAESFITGNSSHSVTSIKLPLQRAGTTPGTVTVSLRHADTNYLPTGFDINGSDTAIYNGNLLPTADYSWTDFVFDYPYPTLEAISAYTIIVRATSGDAANHIHWWANNVIGAIPTIGGNSTDGGATWVSGAPTMYLFRIWGESLISIPHGAIAVQHYDEAGDMVFAAELINTYAPYYPDSTEFGQLFSFQLLDEDGTTVLASVPTQGWNDMPNFIYLSADTAAAISPGASLYVRLYANFGSNPSFSYQLLGSDWKGSLNNLGMWCVQTGKNMEAYWTDLGITTSIIQVGTSAKSPQILTNAGGATFEGALPQLSSKLPNYFASSYTEIIQDEMDFNPGLAQAHKMDDIMGTTFESDINRIGSVFGMTGEEAGSIGWWVIAIALGIIVTAVTHSTVFGLFIGTGALTAGAYLGMVNPAFIAAAVFSVIFLWGVREFVFRGG